MWTSGWREQVWSQLGQPWDLIVIGGGITGAGILREATRAGLRALLFEQHDFASGTSSRSSKLVHGGLRYLKQGEVRLTFESVRERERLLREGRGLVQSLGFLLPTFAGDRPPAWVFGLGLTVYDILALKLSHRHYDALDMRDLCPGLSERGLLGGYRYFDALTDDARLVLRVLREAVRGGGAALSYAPVEGLLRDAAGQVRGVVVRDRADPQSRTAEVRAAVVISATGAWADGLRVQAESTRSRQRLRPLRGSHLAFAGDRLPLRRAISFMHPADRRPLIVVPWEGVTLVGTTDVDHGRALETDPTISPAEVDYLMTAIRYAFPAFELEQRDVVSTWAGIRPVVDTGQADPSKESREHVLWQDHGLLTVTGGKLTTFRLMAHAALQAVRARLPGTPRLDPRAPMLDALPDEAGAAAGRLDPQRRLRLAGRYGAESAALLQCARPGEVAPVGDSAALWAELRWAARAEGVVHLDDLLLRRTRLGLILRDGGRALLDQVRAIAQPELGWDDAAWEREAAAYRRLWRAAYAPPGGAG